MDTLELKLEDNEKVLKENKEALKRFLWSNTGNCTTKRSDDSILTLVENISICSYNIGFYKAQIKARKFKGV